jgi:DNA replicative helicase MCM subunit Mcm2 (Cdc46/Mcm family)
VATQQAATDPKTGLIDMDIIGTGTTSLSRANIEDIISIIKGLIREHEDRFRRGVKCSILYDDVRRKLLDVKRSNNQNNNTEEEINEFEFRDAIKCLEDDYVLATFGNVKDPLVRYVQRQDS